MKLSELRELLKDKRVIEEINKHLWIESQKVGYSIGIERATDEWIRLYANGWMKYNMPSKYAKFSGRKKSNLKKTVRKKSGKKTGKVVKKKTKKAVRKKKTKKKKK